MNIKVTTSSAIGKRKYMEDRIQVKFGTNPVPYLFLAVFDGHGGFQAAEFAKEHLLGEITAHEAFWSSDVDKIEKSLKDAFISTHNQICEHIDSWPKSASGYPSTSGTTASVVFIKDKLIVTAHVGDSDVVLGTKGSFGNYLTSETLTTIHKPTSEKECKRIEADGGSVKPGKNGVLRVVWSRPINAKFPEQSFHHVPFLAMTRALGDTWSFNSKTQKFFVSPEPYVSVRKLDGEVKCIVLASDGCWDMLDANEAVDLIHIFNKKNEDHEFSQNPAARLVNLALEKWESEKKMADNISVIVCEFEVKHTGEQCRGQKRKLLP